jgi:hypothetical protein
MSKLDRTTLAKLAKQLGISFGWFVAMLIVSSLFLFIALNVAGLKSSFVLGLTAPIVMIGAVIAFIWAAHPSTKVLWGTIIGTGTACVLVGLFVVLFVNHVFSSIEASFLLWGMLDFILLAGGTALMFLFGNTYKKIH